MQLGMIGMGRMGANMARRLMGDGHTCVVHNPSYEKVRAMVDEGATGAASLEGLVDKLDAPRSVWLMVPAAAVDPLVGALAALLEPGDLIIDGGNSHFRDDMRRAASLAARDLRYMDVGTSGGVWGLERGYCLMIGGREDDVARMEPVLRSLSPGPDAAPATPGRTGKQSTAEQGYLHCGPHGAGHYAKMIHNGIEYGMMAAYAEGLEILRAAGSMTPPDPDHPGFDFDVAELTELWRRGSVIGSWLLDLTAGALARDPDLSGFSVKVADSGEGRWTVQAAVDQGVPAHVLSAALYERFSSRGQADFASRVLSAMRFEFGGHTER
jgi:6-phosphogluconate dehydrogenase